LEGVVAIDQVAEQVRRYPRPSPIPEIGTLPKIHPLLRAFFLIFQSGVNIISKMKKIYIIEDKNRGASKVGVSKNPIKRLCTCQTHNPGVLQLVFTSKLLQASVAFKLESYIHGLLKCHGLHLHGEWFKTTKKLIGITADVASQYNSDAQHVCPQHDVSLQRAQTKQDAATRRATRRENKRREQEEKKRRKQEQTHHKEEEKKRKRQEAQQIAENVIRLCQFDASQCTTSIKIKEKKDQLVPVMQKMYPQKQFRTYKELIGRMIHVINNFSNKNLSKIKITRVPIPGSQCRVKCKRTKSGTSTRKRRRRVFHYQLLPIKKLK